jgi:hypothetical protein
MSLLERVVSVLSDEGIKAEVNECGVHTVIATGMVASRLRVFETPHFLKTILYLGLHTPVYRRPEMALALSLANFELHFGAFEMDNEDGELRFRASLPIDDTEIGTESLRCLLLFPPSVVARYSMALAEVATGAADAGQAISRSEASWKEEAAAERVAQTEAELGPGRIQ